MRKSLSVLTFSFSRPILLFSAGLLLASACTPTAQPSPTAAPPKPAAEQPAAKAEQKPAAKPAEQVPAPVATETALKNTRADASKFKKDAPWRIALSAQGPINAWGTLFDLHARYAIEQYGDKVKEFLYADSQANPQKQISDMEDLIAKKPDAIMITPMGKAALAAPVERAVAREIPVIVCASSVDSPNITAEVQRSYYDTAGSAMDWLAKRLDGKGKIVMLHGIAGVDTAETWKAHAHDVLKRYPGIQVVAEQYANWSVADGKKATQTILAANPQIDGVWVGGAEMAIGAIDAFAESGKKLPPFGVTNPQNGFLRLAKQHNLEFFAMPYPPGVLGKTCVDTAVKVLQGESVPKYIDIVDSAENVRGFTNKDLDQVYRPEFSDDYIFPTLVPDEQLKTAGFGRKQ